jgi:tetratricopeptide (TPR) repeat protein
VEGGRFADAVEALAAAASVDYGGSRLLQTRALTAEASARLSLGEVAAATDLAGRASHLARSGVGDVEQARALFELGRCRLTRQSLATAASIFSEALTCAVRASSSDRLRRSILEHRAQCYRLQRKNDAARADFEAALEITARLQNPRDQAESLMVDIRAAEAVGSWGTVAAGAERAKVLFAQADDLTTTSRLFGSLGTLAFAMGETDNAVELLTKAYESSVAAHADLQAGELLTSLAVVYLGREEYILAHMHASRALSYLVDRDDVEPVGRANLVLGQALIGLNQLGVAERHLRDSERLLTQLSSAPKLAPVMKAFGDLATRRQDHEEAARCYRAAAEALQDIKF